MDAEDEKLAPPITVISERYWRRRFGGDPAVIGKSISIGRKAFTIVGVTPAEFFGLQPGSPVDITFPIDKNGELVKNSETLWLHGIIARLKPGASADAAQAEADSIYRSFMSTSRFPTDLIAKHWRHLQILPAAHGMDGLRRRFSKPLYALTGIVGLVQLLAIANVANLLLARGISRGREFAIRLAAGAGRTRIVRQLLTETLLLFCLGAVPGVLALLGKSVDRKLVSPRSSPGHDRSRAQLAGVGVRAGSHLLGRSHLRPVAGLASLPVRSGAGDKRGARAHG